MRRLLYIPIVHTASDMGSMARGLEQASIETAGRRLAAVQRTAVDEMWDGLERKTLCLPLPPRFLLYQDGLPLCGIEEEIITKTADRGSRNYRLLVQLMARGGVPVGTEDPELLVEEYQAVRDCIEASPRQKSAATSRYREKSVRLLLARDAFVAQRVDETLPEDGLGLLFMGLMHRVDERLPEDIDLHYLIHRLPFKRDFNLKLLNGGD